MVTCIVIVVGIVLVCFANKFDDCTHNNLFSAIFCVASLASATFLGLTAIVQNSIYNNKECESKRKEEQNIACVIDKIQNDNDEKIKSWNIEKESIFKLSESSSFHIVELEIIGSSIFNAKNLDIETFKKICDYDSIVKKINNYICNYNMCKDKDFKKERDEYKTLLITEATNLLSFGKFSSKN